MRPTCWVATHKWGTSDIVGIYKEGEGSGEKTSTKRTRHQVCLTSCLLVGTCGCFKLLFSFGISN